MPSASANAAMAHKLATIRAIQAKGFRVLVRQDKRVVIWRKGDESREWKFGRLEDAERNCDMLNWISSQGWTVEFKAGHVYVSKGANVGDYRSLKAAYFALGGPEHSIFHNPKGLKP